MSESEPKKRLHDIRTERRIDQLLRASTIWPALSRYRNLLEQLVQVAQDHPVTRLWRRIDQYEFSSAESLIASFQDDKEFSSYLINIYDATSGSAMKDPDKTLEQLVEDFQVLLTSRKIDIARKAKLEQLRHDTENSFSFPVAQTQTVMNSSFFENDFLDELTQRINGPAFLGRFLKIQARGNRHYAVCPFHKDNKPSFLIRDDGSFYCFGCHEKGTIFNFLMKRNGLSFPEVVKEVAQFVDMPLSTQQGRAGPSNEQHLIPVSSAPEEPPQFDRSFENQLADESKFKPKKRLPLYYYSDQTRRHTNYMLCASTTWPALSEYRALLEQLVQVAEDHPVTRLWLMIDRNLYEFSSAESLIASFQYDKEFSDYLIERYDASSESAMGKDPNKTLEEFCDYLIERCDESAMRKDPDKTLEQLIENFQVLLTSQKIEIEKKAALEQLRQDTETKGNLSKPRFNTEDATEEETRTPTQHTPTPRDEVAYGREIVELETILIALVPVFIFLEVVIGIALYCMWLHQLMEWLGGFFGFIVATFLVPGALIYPVVHWWVEGYWPEIYLWFYLAGILVAVARSLATTWSSPSN